MDRTPKSLPPSGCVTATASRFPTCQPQRNNTS
jgi:hypothetical protein